MYDKMRVEWNEGHCYVWEWISSRETEASALPFTKDVKDRENDSEKGCKETAFFTARQVIAISGMSRSHTKFSLSYLFPVNTYAVRNWLLLQYTIKGLRQYKTKV